MTLRQGLKTFHLSILPPNPIYPPAVLALNLNRNVPVKIKRIEKENVWLKEN